MMGAIQERIRWRVGEMWWRGGGEMGRSQRKEEATSERAKTHLRPVTLLGQIERKRTRSRLCADGIVLVEALQELKVDDGRGERALALKGGDASARGVHDGLRW